MPKCRQSRNPLRVYGVNRGSWAKNTLLSTRNGPVLVQIVRQNHESWWFSTDKHKKSFLSVTKQCPYSPLLQQRNFCLGKWTFWISLLLSMSRFVFSTSQRRGKTVTGNGNSWEQARTSPLKPQTSIIHTIQPWRTLSWVLSLDHVCASFFPGVVTHLPLHITGQGEDQRPVEGELQHVVPEQRRLERL